MFRISVAGARRCSRTCSPRTCAWVPLLSLDSAEVKELIDAGDQVITVLHETAKMGDTNVPLDRDLVQVWTVRDARLTFLKVFQTKAEALEAAGLSE